MELPVFALHTVLFPGQRLELHVFEERYLLMLEDILPSGSIAIVAIRRGQEVGGPAEPYRVGVRASVRAHEQREDGSHSVELLAQERVSLIAPLQELPYPRWSVAPFPDEGGAGTDDVEAALRALDRFLVASGEVGTASVDHEPVSASFALAGAVPGLVPDRQQLLEAPGAGLRLQMTRQILTREASLLRILRSVPGGPEPEISPN